MTDTRVPKPGTRQGAVLILTACGWTRTQIKRALNLDAGEVARTLSKLNRYHGIEIRTRTRKEIAT